MNKLFKCPYNIEFNCSLTEPCINCKQFVDYTKREICDHDRMVLCTVWDYEAPKYHFTITLKTRTNVEFTTEPQMGYSTC